MKKQVTVLGAGAWGTAIANLLAHNGHPVLLWCYEENVAYEIKTLGTNFAYLPNIQLNERIMPITSLYEAVSSSTWIFETVPVKFLRGIVTQAQEAVSPQATWVVLSKGIEHETLLVPTQIIENVLGASTKTAVLAGPNFAKELADKQFTATTIASHDQVILSELYQMLVNHYFRPFSNNDPIGVQVASAIKNVLALAAGICFGSGCKDNTIAYLLTHGLAEIGLIAQHYGGKAETMYGLSGLGDMILTCNGTLSKNLRAGRLFAQGRSLGEIKDIGGFEDQHQTQRGQSQRSACK